MRGSLAPLAEREFRLLFLGRTVSIVGNAFATTAIAFAVLDVTGSKADLGYVLAARALPQVVFLLAGGVWADRLPPPLGMVASNVVSGASQGVLAALLLTRTAGFTRLILLSAVDGTGTPVFFPASRGIVLQFSIVNAAETGSMNVLGPAVAKEHFGGAAGWGAVLAADAIGLVCGGVAMLRFRPRRMLLWATLAIFLMPLVPLALAVPLVLPLVIVSAFLAGAGVEVFGVLWETTMQQEIPGDRLSRVSSYDALGSFALIPLGFATAGAVAAAIGTRATFFGAAVLITGATALVLLIRSVRTLERQT